MSLIHSFIENDIKASEGVDTSKISSIKAGGYAKYGIYPENLGSLIKAVKICLLLEIKFKIIGGCTNTFFKDGEYGGAVIFTKKLNRIKICDGYVSCECGCSLSKLLKTCANANLEISNNLFGIPGTLGGAVHNNAGAFGSEICESFSEGLFMNYETTEVMTLRCSDLQYAYRSSLLMREPLIFLQGKLSTKPKDTAICLKEFKKYAQMRRKKQPSAPSLGSFFKRSDNVVPAELIDKAGLKNYRVNDAAISDKHAGFIVNLGNATASDIDLLAKKVEAKIKDMYNVSLQREAELVE